MPVQLFSLRFGKNEPWVQSWKMMKVRSVKPATGIASSSTSQSETWSSAYIAAVSSRYGSTDVARSSIPRLVEGWAYGAKRSRQKDG